MTTRATELCDEFRRGVVGRREFLQRLVVTTGSVVAATHVLSALGFETALVREAQAQEFPFEEGTGQYPMGGTMIDFLARHWIRR